MKDRRYTIEDAAVRLAAVESEMAHILRCFPALRSALSTDARGTLQRPIRSHLRRGHAVTPRQHRNTPVRAYRRRVVFPKRVRPHSAGD